MPYVLYIYAYCLHFVMFDCGVKFTHTLYKFGSLAVGKSYDCPMPVKEPWRLWANTLHASAINWWYVQNKAISPTYGIYGICIYVFCNTPCLHNQLQRDLNIRNRIMSMRDKSQIGYLARLVFLQQTNISSWTYYEIAGQRLAWWKSVHKHLTQYEVLISYNICCYMTTLGHNEFTTKHHQTEFQNSVLGFTKIITNSINSQAGTLLLSINITNWTRLMSYGITKLSTAYIWKLHIWNLFNPKTRHWSLLWSL